MTLPCNAPVGFDALNSGIFYVLEGEALPDLRMVHAHTDLHLADPRQGRSRAAHYLRHGSSTSRAEYPQGAESFKSDIILNGNLNMSIEYYTSIVLTNHTITIMYAFY